MGNWTGISDLVFQQINDMNKGESCYQPNVKNKPCLNCFLKIRVFKVNYNQIGNIVEPGKKVIFETTGEIHTLTGY